MSSNAVAVDQIVSWIHCNSCFFYYDKSDKFYLLNCMHIFCENCLQRKVTANCNKCPFCKRSIKFKRIDSKLDPKLLTVLDPDPSTELASFIRSMELNINQTNHFHAGLVKAAKAENEIVKQHQMLDEESIKIKAKMAKVMARNEMITKMIVQEERRKQRRSSRASDSGFISSSQNVSSQSMGPPPIPAKYISHSGHRPRANVTRLSSIRTGQKN